MGSDHAENTAALKVLVIDDEENMRHMLTNILSRAGYVVQSAADGEKGLAVLTSEGVDFVLCDIRMPKMDGLSFLKASKEAAFGTTIVMMSAYGTIDMAVEAMKLGAYDFVSKPFNSDEILLTLQKAQERDFLTRENQKLKKQIENIEKQYRFGSLVAKSDSMQAVFELAEKVAQYDTTVLILGESGTGKELVARAIHNEGARSDAPLVPVNCGSIPEDLLESELFGYIKGAFTGADSAKAGLFEQAHHGTIFLDEIGELPLILQVKLLRVLQENEIRPVGASQTKTVDVRVIAATSRDLSQMVSEGAFREDLFYRLNVLSIHIPALRERKEDIPLLCRYFISRFNTSLGLNIQKIEPEAMLNLIQYRWPGNVRELENAIERAMVLSNGKKLSQEYFIFGNIPIQKGDLNRTFEGYSIKDAQKIVEKELIIKALKATNGNRTQASKLLQISHPSLLSKMKAYEIDL